VQVHGRGRVVLESPRAGEADLGSGQIAGLGRTGRSARLLRPRIWGLRSRGSRFISSQRRSAGTSGRVQIVRINSEGQVREPSRSVRGLRVLREAASLSAHIRVVPRRETVSRGRLVRLFVLGRMDRVRDVRSLAGHS